MMTAFALCSAYLKTLLELALLLVNYAQSKINFVGFLEVRLHAHNLRKGLFGMLETAVAIVQNSYAVP